MPAYLHILQTGKQKGIWTRSLSRNVFTWATSHQSLVVPYSTFLKVTINSSSDSGLGDKKSLHFSKNNIGSGLSFILLKVGNCSLRGYFPTNLRPKSPKMGNSLGLDSAPCHPSMDCWLLRECCLITTRTGMSWGIRQRRRTYAFDSGHITDHAFKTLGALPDLSL